jgi:hypothetical protein
MLRRFRAAGLEIGFPPRLKAGIPSEEEGGRSRPDGGQQLERAVLASLSRICGHAASPRSASALGVPSVQEVRAGVRRALAWKARSVAGIVASDEMRGGPG